MPMNAFRFKRMPMTPSMNNKDIILFGVGVLVAVGILTLDIAIPLGVADGILYIALVLIAFFIKSKNFIYVGAITGTLLTITGFFVSPPGGEFWQVIANRFLITFTHKILRSGLPAEPEPKPGMGLMMGGGPAGPPKRVMITGGHRKIYSHRYEPSFGRKNSHLRHSIDKNF